MPQLGSGRHVALSSDTSLALARKGNLGLTMGFTLHVKTLDDLTPLIEIAYFKPIAPRLQVVLSDGTVRDAGPGTPYRSGLLLSDIGTPNCDWSDDEIGDFNVWLRSEPAQRWLQATYDELKELIDTVKPPIPDNLKGIFEAD